MTRGLCPLSPATPVVLSSEDHSGSVGTLLWPERATGKGLAAC